MEFQIKAMDMWFRLLPGALLVELELQQLDKLLPAIPGEIALQIGGPSNLRLLQKSRVPHVFYCSDQMTHKPVVARVQCHYDELPFSDETVNLVVIAHALEFCDHPRALLGEVYRVLKPGGQLIVLGFNRWSRWSLVQKRSQRKGYPWSGKFQSIWQIKHWLNQLGYGVIANKSFYFLGPVQTRPQSTWQRLSEVLGQVFIPKMGAVHLIYAQKKTAGATPLAAIWSGKRVRVKGAVAKPTTRVTHEKN